MRSHWAWVTLKQHRFEVAAAAVLLMGAAGWATATWYRAVAIDVPAGCIDGWLIDGPAARPECAGPMLLWGGVIGGAGDTLFAAMAVIPFLVGLLAGTPIVARELETGTAQTAWWLHPSRGRWLARQLGAIGLPVLLLMSLAALAVAPIVALDTAWGHPESLRIGLHGPAAVARATAAFGVSVLVGTLAARTLPGFVTSSALMLVVAIGISFARDGWVRGLDPIVIGAPDPGTGELVVEARATFTAWAWRTPAGQISRVEGPGYESVMLGVTDEAALGWQSIDAIVYGSIAGVTLIGAGIAVQQRRPR